jgi:hypothetical protein
MHIFLSAPEANYVALSMADTERTHLMTARSPKGPVAEKHGELGGRDCAATSSALRDLSTLSAQSSHSNQLLHPTVSLAKRTKRFCLGLCSYRPIVRLLRQSVGVVPDQRLNARMKDRISAYPRSSAI